MIEYFRLNSPNSLRLTASGERTPPDEIALCSVTEGLKQHRSSRRVGDLQLEVKHNDTGQWLIFAWLPWLGGPVVHARLLEEFARRGFTGYRLRPATVRFRNGHLSSDYSELIVTGWAGVAPPESGIKLTEACPGCGHKKYSVVLDVLGYVPGDEAVRSLEEAVTLADPRLKAFAVLSLLRRGEHVEPDQIEQVAASLEMRMTFWRQLGKIGRQSLMPAQWACPSLLAASDLCHWASHPNELGVPPEEVELMAEVPVKSEEGELDEVFLFRFREYPKPWTPGEGWMAGIAGLHDSPWSSFKGWDSMSPREHFEKLFYR